MNKSKIMHRGIFYVSAIIGCLLLAGTLATAMNSPGSCYKCQSEGPMANISSRDATLSITCWEGYAQPYVKDFQALIENKYNLNLEIKIHNPTDQKEFYQAAKEGTADLISPPIELPKIPRFYSLATN